MTRWSPGFANAVRFPLPAVLLLALLLLGGAPGSLTRETGVARAADLISLQQVASGLSSPLGITHAGDSRLFITEQTGAIRILSGGTVLPVPFLDVSSLVSSGSERGLLGLAFHPNYPATPYFYIDYTNASGDIVLARYSVSGDPNVASPASGLSLLTIPHQVNANHNGGQLRFGPDGKLYVGVGDGGGAGDTMNNAQSLSVLLGKILRLDVDIAAPYIPATNPFVSTPGAKGEIWAYGLRNPWRFSFDRSTGDLFTGDVGQGLWEEVDFQPQASAGGQNYGWRFKEGNHCYNPSTACDPGGLTAPIVEYGHGAGECAVIGGVRYRGALPSLAGSYLYGDFCTGRIWGATPAGGGAWTSTQLVDTPYFLSSFGEDINGEVYVSDVVRGGIYKIVVPDADGDGVVDGADNCPNNANPGQENHDANFTDISPPRMFDDTTWINSDTLGDACDPDADNDGLSNVVEAGLGPGGPSHAQCPAASAATSSLLIDTDGDRFVDSAECALGTDPADAMSKPMTSPPGDTDHDGLTDAFEGTIGTNPNLPDTDGDALLDGVEYLRYGSSPTNPNTDGDTCGDGREAASVNDDQKVNSTDQLIIAQSFGLLGSPKYNLDFDVNRDDRINSTDQLITAKQFGVC